LTPELKKKCEKILLKLKSTPKSEFFNKDNKFLKIELCLKHNNYSTLSEFENEMRLHNQIKK